ncbi:MAG TPA: ATP-binding protein, partial [Candidatus Saccharimonadales bacterium]|nr:ATP-binding protein [Candidatus Saccharimonadales bacterium]
SPQAQTEPAQRQEAVRRRAAAVQRELLDYMARSADQLSRSITSATWHAMLADQRQAAYEVMQTIATKQGIHRIRFFNKDGKVTFSTDHADVKMADMRDETCYVCHARKEPLSRVAIPSRTRIYTGADGLRKLGMVTPIYNEPACSTAPCHAHPADRNVLGVLDLSLDLDQVDHDLAEMKGQVVLEAGAEILLITLVIVFFTWRFVRRPIRRLVEATKQVSVTQLDRPVEVASKDELGELARSFEEMRLRLKGSVHELNELAQSLEQRVEERTEQLAVARQKLIQTDRLTSLGQLAASVAHEINNPVAGVLNLAMLMKRMMKEEGLDADQTRQYRAYVEEVITETRRVGRIVSDLLAFSRRPSPQRGPADLNEIARKTLSLLDHKLKLAGVRVELALDASQIQQVMVNLVSNAAEAMPGGGVLAVRSRLSGSGESAVFDVADTGVGIPPELLGRIYDPFFTTKEEGKGTGLGLAVSYGIVHAHKGDLEVESRVGAGTTFRVILPLSPTGGDAIQEAAGTAAPARGPWTT